MALENKKILIVGSSAKEHALASVFAKYDFIEKIYAAPGNDVMGEFCERVDIRPENTSELLNFVLENAVDMTICSDESAVKADLVSLFQANGQLIFGPSAASAFPAISKSAGKKLFYRLRIPTPKFGIFEKQQPAIEYLKKSEFPVVIRTDESTEGADRQVCNNIQTASVFVEDLFVSGAQKILLEDFVYGHEFIMYVITDGYHFLPLTTFANYKFMSDGNGGILTPGMGGYCPDYKLSYEIQNRILYEVVEPVDRVAHHFCGYGDKPPHCLHLKTLQVSGVFPLAHLSLGNRRELSFEIQVALSEFLVHLGKREILFHRGAPRIHLSCHGISRREPHTALIAVVTEQQYDADCLQQQKQKPVVMSCKKV